MQSDAEFEPDGSKNERTLLERPVYFPFRVRDGSKASQITAISHIIYVLFPRNSKLLHLGYEIEDATSHEVDGGNNDDETVPCSVGQDYLAISFYGLPL